MKKKSKKKITKIKRKISKIKKNVSKRVKKRKNPDLKLHEGTEWETKISNILERFSLDHKWAGVFRKNQTEFVWVPRDDLEKDIVFKFDRLSDGSIRIRTSDGESKKIIANRNDVYLTIKDLIFGYDD